MRTQYALVLVMAIGVVGLMMSLSGFNAAFGVSEQDTIVGDQFEDKAKGSSVGDDGEPLEGSAGSSEFGDLRGLAIGGITAIFDMIALVVLLPVKLQAWGYPYWFAYPAGLATQTLLSIGGIQFATNRVFQ